jgi:uncharacterized protein
VPSTKAELIRVPVATLANGHPLELFVHTLRGSEDGPTLGLVGGIHGDEPLGVETVRRVLGSVDPARLRGTIVAVPVANAYALQALTRNQPLDMANLNRVFPGDPDGTITEQLAHTICEELVGGWDAFIDFHSGGNLATVDYAYIHADDDLAKAYGSEVLYRGPSFPGSLGQYARDRGIRTVVSELGGGQQRNAHFLAKGVRGARGVMQQLGMLDGVPERPDGQVVVTGMATLRPHHGGTMLSEVDATRLGERVPGGTVLARVVSPYTFEELEVLTAPYDPSILVLVREPVTTVQAGDYGFMVADGSTATPA